MNSGDHQYWEAISSGDRQGLEAIYQEFASGTIHLVTRSGGNREDARDVFQSALIVLFQQVREGKTQPTGSFGGFLYAICRNIWGNRLQKKSFKEVSLPDDIKYTLEAPPGESIEEEEKRRLFRDKMKQLGADCRRLLELFFAGHSMEEIRREMGYGSVSYASKRKFGCKEQLITLIREDARFRELNI